MSEIIQAIQQLFWWALMVVSGVGFVVTSFVFVCLVLREKDRELAKTKQTR